MFGKPDLARQVSQAVLAVLKQAPPEGEFTFQSLYLKVHPKSPELLAKVLDQLAKQGALQRVFRVVSPVTKIGIGDYSTLDEIPETMDDSTSGLEIAVDPDHIKPIFKPATLG